MRIGLLIWMTLGWQSMMATEMTFYIGTYSAKDAGGGIWRSQLNDETGKLGPVKLAASAENPTFLALAPNGRLLYAAIETNEGEAAAYAIEANQTLRLLNHQSAGGSGTCYVSVDPTGKKVLAANYGGGSVSVLPILADGSLSERSALVSFTGSGPNARQAQPFAHAFDALGGFAYACDLGSDNVWSFRFSDGKVTPLEPAAGKVPAGSGPRHSAFSADGKFVYVMNELIPGVTVFNRDLQNGKLTPIQTISSLPEGTNSEGITGAEIALHPLGKWLYVSNRKHNSLTVFAVASDGTLSWIENISAGVKNPRSFAIDSSGKWLLAAGQSDNRIVVFQINSSTGKLTATNESVTVASPVCLLFSRSP